MQFRAILYYLPFLDNTLITCPPSDDEIRDSKNYDELITSNCDINNKGLSLTFTLGINTDLYINYLQDKFNCIRVYAINVKGDETPLGDYKINSAYQNNGGSKIRFNCELSQYQIVRLPLQKYEVNYETEYNIPFLLRTTVPSFVEYGYYPYSILRGDGTVNWSKEMTTDLYCPPVQSIDKNVFQGRQKIAWDIFNLNNNKTVDIITYRDVLNHGCKHWVNIYVRTGSKIGDDTIGYSYLFNYQKFKKAMSEDNVAECNMSPPLPYEIITFSIADDRSYGFSTSMKEGGISGDENTVYYSVVYLDNLMERIFNTIGRENILQITSTPVPPFIDIATEGQDINVVDFKYFEIPYNANRDYYLKPIKISGIDFKASDIYLFRCNKLNGSLYNSLAYELTDFSDLTGDIAYENLSYEYASSDLTTIDNPYIALHTHDIVLTSPNGAKYTVNLLNLGLINKLILSLIYTFELGASNYLCGINLAESDLPYYVQNNGVNLINTSLIGVGLTGSNANSFVYSIDQLAEYLLNNKNFYLTRDANVALQREQLAVNNGTSVFSSLLAFAATAIASVATGNPVPIIAGASSAIGNIVGTGVKSIAGVDAIQASLDNSNRALDNLANAPDKLINASSPFTDIITSDCGFYINFYTTTDVVKSNLLSDFINKGIYLNKYVSNITPYLNISDSKFDKKYCKYIKVNADIGVLPLNFPYTYSNFGTSKASLGIFEKMLRDGMYMRKTRILTYDNEVANYRLNGAQVEAYIQFVEPIKSFN